MKRGTHTVLAPARHRARAHHKGGSPMLSTVRKTLFLAAIAGATAPLARADSITTGFNATSTLASAAPANYFDLTALNPAGLTVNRFDVNSNLAAGTAQTVTIWYKPGTFV